MAAGTELEGSRGRGAEATAQATAARFRVPSSQQKRAGFKRELKSMMEQLLLRAVNAPLESSQGLFSLDPAGMVQVVFSLAAVDPHENGSTSKVPTTDAEMAWNNGTWLVGSALYGELVTAEELCAHLQRRGLLDLTITPGGVQKRVYPGWTTPPKAVWVVRYTFPADELSESAEVHSQEEGSAVASKV
jgi:hypothetical protein